MLQHLKSLKWAERMRADGVEVVYCDACRTLVRTDRHDCIRRRIPLGGGRSQEFVMQTTPQGLSLRPRVYAPREEVMQQQARARQEAINYELHEDLARATPGVMERVRTDALTRRTGVAPIPTYGDELLEPAPEIRAADQAAHVESDETMAAVQQPAASSSSNNQPFRGQGGRS